MTLVCERKTPLNGKVRVLPKDHILKRWHKEEGEIVAIVGDRYPFAYQVQLDSGIDLVFKGDEIEEIWA